MEAPDIVFALKRKIAIAAANIAWQRNSRPVGEDAHASAFEFAGRRSRSGRYRDVDPGRYGLISTSAHCVTIVISMTHQCVCTSWLQQHVQWNRVKKSIRNETCQVIVIPTGDLLADAQGWQERFVMRTS
jgi:hypothetical protein